MSRNIQEPTLDETGHEHHPAFGRVVMNRSSYGPGGASLFDSEIKHQRVVTLAIHEADRKRDLNRDWIHPSKVIVEIAMSEAQWASMVSSFHDGGGTSCTITYRQGEGIIPGIPFEPRLALSMAEVEGAARKVYEEVDAALAAVEEKPTKANVRALRIALGNAAPNMEFAARSLTEHAENVVQKARADIEAMVEAHAERLSLDPATTVAALALNPGSTEEGECSNCGGTKAHPGAVENGMTCPSDWHREA